MPAFINLQQYYLEKALVDRALEIDVIDLRWRNRVAGLDAAQRRCAADDRDAGRSLPARRRMGDCRRRRALDRPRPHGPRIQGRHLRGQVPDRRRPHGGGFPDRAAVLVRSAIPFRPIGADAPPARQCVAHRSAARARRRCRGGAEAGARDPAPEEDAGRARFRARMGVDLSLQLPPARSLRAWPRDLCRRCRASGVAVRRARRQFRRAGCRESRLEACRPC